MWHCPLSVRFPRKLRKVLTCSSFSICCPTAHADGKRNWPFPDNLTAGAGGLQGLLIYLVCECHQAAWQPGSWHLAVLSLLPWCCLTEPLRKMKLSFPISFLCLSLSAKTFPLAWPKHTHLPVSLNHFISNTSPCQIIRSLLLNYRLQTVSQNLDWGVDYISVPFGNTMTDPALIHTSWYAEASLHANASNWR